MRQLMVGLPLLLVALAVAWPAGAVRHAPVPEPIPLPAAPAPLSPEEIADASAIIDRLVDAGLAAAGQAPNPPTSDEQFVRRAHLAIIGRIPTLGEAQAFLASSAPGKRDVLIARLLASEGRVLHVFTFLADLLRVQTRLADRYPGQTYIAWIKRALRENRPYDRLVRELVTAQGPLLEAGNGATGFVIRDAGMPLDHLASLTQVFLGTRIGCAQCHDHPFDTWTRKQFHELAAYTHGADLQRDLPGGRELRKRLQANEGGMSPEARRVLQQLGNSVGVRVKGTTTSTLTLPADYQYDDAAPGSVVAAATIFGDAAPVAPRRDPRPVFAAWLTVPSNPRFATVIANRLWKRAFGIGLIEPVDDLTDATVASDPALMEFLTRLMIGVGYDLRRFEQALYGTRAWQRQASAAEPVAGEPYRFPGPLLRRLSAEQVWDSLLTLRVADPDAGTGDDGGELTAAYARVSAMSVDELVALVSASVEARVRAQELQQQAKALRAQLGDASGAQAKALRKRLGEVEKQRHEQVAKAELGRAPGGTRVAKRGGEARLRAAELPSPAPPGHFLRIFGQSDRQTIDNATSDAAVTQALALLNGPFAAQLLATEGPLAQALARATDGASRVRALHLAILSRQPTPSELALGTAYLARWPDEGVADLAWALTNGREFLFLP